MYIYLTTNLINGKKYIGQHNGTKRWYLGSGSIMLKAVKKYGAKNFKKEILCYCETQEELDLKEEYYITLYNAVEDSIFYNLQPGGKGGRHSEKSKKKMSEARKGIKLSEEHKQKLSESHKGKRNTPEAAQKVGDKLKGVPRPKEVRDKISEKHKGKSKKYEVSKCYKPIYCYEIITKKIVVYKSTADAYTNCKVSYQAAEKQRKKYRRCKDFIFFDKIEDLIKIDEILKKKKFNHV